MTTVAASASSPDQTDLAQQYDTPLGVAHSTMQALKDRIKLHYDLASDYYLNLWGEHIHHGYWPTKESEATLTKEEAQINLIQLLLDISHCSPNTTVLDVGCGIGGTSRHLAAKYGCTVTGVTISSKQVEIANRLTKAASESESNGVTDPTSVQQPGTPDADGFTKLGSGKVRFIELDAEKMADFFDGQGGTFGTVWISEALSHFPNKSLFFENAFRVLQPGGKLVLADWFKAEDLDETTFVNDIRPIEDGMLLPPLLTQQGYVDLATQAGLHLISEPKDISQEVRKTWDITWSLVQSPSLWAFAFSQGRDGIAFLQSFRAMRRGYSNGSFRYAVMAFNKRDA
ncbi:S-adenosyl-L-methionine-dependent methyltransferase [Dactylonectria macrodidyma]|uniref:S-adenosyl-L-methionine-dependent methyltransferase n=1 Tax=Dactylonectria macrodidyma TaxID=307937 RepID=A0A9P9EWZ9_9HYPO|nr:S-adenosyl-L-methionine-dependent methyltransferase [Dactylonectria macrodidyma]